MLKKKCDLCGKLKYVNGSVYLKLHKHHRVPGKENRECKDGEITDKGVLQKLFYLCYDCHLNWVHSKSPRRRERFLEKWGRKLSDFLYLKEK